MLVRIRHRDGMCRVTCAEEDSVARLKQLIESHLGVSQAEQRLKATGETSAAVLRDATTLQELGVANGHMFYLTTSQPPKKRPRAAAAATTSSSSKTSAANNNNKKKKKSAKKTHGIPTYDAFSANADPAVVAQHLVSDDDGTEGADEASIALRLHTQTRAEQRVGAAAKRSVTVEEWMDRDDMSDGRFTSSAHSRGGKTLHVVYKLNRKTNAEIVPLLAPAAIEDAFEEALARLKTASARSATWKPLFEAVKVAARCPPVFWSVYHNFPSRSVQQSLDKIRDELTDN